MSAIWVEHGLCKACYLCARNCPANAIKVDKGQARIDDTLCINCGNCLRTCGNKIKMTDAELPKVEEMIAKGSNIIGIMDPCYQASFGLTQAEPLFRLMQEKGFAEIIDSRAGLELIMDDYQALASEGHNNPLLVANCPVIVEIIERKFPELLPYLAPVDSTPLALAKYIKHISPKKKVVYIGPCLARKNEFNRFGPNIVDAVLSFSELKELLGNQWTNIVLQKEGNSVASSDIKVSSNDATSLVVQGQTECNDFLNNLKNGMSIKPRFVDIYFCKGCLDGPLIDSELDVFSRKFILDNQRPIIAKPTFALDQNVLVDYRRCYVDKHYLQPAPSEEEIRAILKHTFKRSEDYDINCGLCGFETCHARAVAVYADTMEIDMCVPYLLAKSRGEIEYFKNQFDHEFNTSMSSTGLIGSSKPMKYLRNLTVKVSQNEATVLLLGESGVGKEVVAKAIHVFSGRKKEPFVGINCAALPDLLLESELFGYEDGAFTGAKKGGKEGRFELAAEGTILLDEIGDLPLAMQAKLLRVLQEKEFSRLGGTAVIPLNARIIAATNKDLQQMVDEGKFRADLFYRLNVISIQVPSLKERKEDIPALMGHFLRKVAADKSLSSKIFSDDALRLMMAYDWPGNIRELENVIERLIYTCESNVIKADDLPPHVQKSILTNKEELEVGSLKNAVKELEKSMVIKALRATGNNKAKAAFILGLPRASFYQKLKEYALM